MRGYSWREYRVSTRTVVERCCEHARQGTGSGACDTVLIKGQCPNASNHISPV